MLLKDKGLEKECSQKPYCFPSLPNGLRLDIKTATNATHGLIDYVAYDAGMEAGAGAYASPVFYSQTSLNNVDRKTPTAMECSLEMCIHEHSARVTQGVLSEQTTIVPSKPSLIETSRTEDWYILGYKLTPEHCSGDTSGSRRRVRTYDGRKSSKFRQ